MLFGQVMDPLRGEALLEEMHCRDHGGEESADFEGLQSYFLFLPFPKHSPCFLSEGEKVTIQFLAPMPSFPVVTDSLPLEA